MNYNWKTNTRTKRCRNCNEVIPYHSNQQFYCNDKCKRAYYKKDKELRGVIEDGK